MRARNFNHNLGIRLSGLMAVVLFAAASSAAAVPPNLNSSETFAARLYKVIDIYAVASSEAVGSLRSGTCTAVSNVAASGSKRLSSAVKCPKQDAACAQKSNASETGAVRATRGNTATYLSCPNAATRFMRMGGGPVDSGGPRFNAAAAMSTNL